MRVVEERWRLHEVQNTSSTFRGEFHGQQKLMKMEAEAEAAAEVVPAPPRLTLKQVLELPPSVHLDYSPRDVFHGPWHYDDAYADTMVCTRVLKQTKSDEEGVDYQQKQRQKPGLHRCFNTVRPRWRCGQSGDEELAAVVIQAAEDAAAGKDNGKSAAVFRRLSTFPSSAGRQEQQQRSLSLRLIPSWSFKKVSPLQLSGTNWKSFSYKELDEATNSFDPENIVGKGGHADVYRARWMNRFVAVKRLVRGEEDERFAEFLAELGVLAHVSHPNTAALLGFGVEGGLFLVFDFFPKGSLAAVLHGEEAPIDWAARFRVAVGTARGLCYLHTGCKRRIIHRDIKASNILLGDDFEPQITDFGLAKWLPKDWTHHTVPVEGTFGYLAPEYFMHGIVDEKTDVFAFGVLLLELITGLRPIDSSQKSLVMKVKPFLDSDSEDLHELVDSRLKGHFDSDEMQRTVLAAKLCTRYASVTRPSMGQVVDLLTEGRRPRCNSLLAIMSAEGESMRW